jgi:diaminohydroxyphosphoribosylaminopyrimidine deaminase / 5-amino-6-(5-phosphoribosylamino)uracil reductase
VGIGTVLADDPLLTARDVGAVRQPARVVFDSGARLPLDSALVRGIDEAPLVVVIGPGADGERARRIEGAGAELIVASGRRPSDRVASALADLGRRRITNLLLEGGPALAGSFATAGQIDELRLFVAPLLLGGGRPALEGGGADAVAEGLRALAMKSEPSGDDVLISARMREW